MKKRKLLLLASLIVIVLSVFGGIAYADITGHEPIHGDKLAGWGRSGAMIGVIEKTVSRLDFLFTNPDCVNTITIDKISLIDQGTGEIMYEGILKRPDGTPIYELAPHQSASIGAIFYYPDPANPGQYLTPFEALNSSPPKWVYAEVYFSAPGGSCPLIGVRSEAMTTTNVATNAFISRTETHVPMELMNQKVNSNKK